jgi:hypothetical protein
MDRSNCDDHTGTLINTRQRAMSTVLGDNNQTHIASEAHRGIFEAKQSKFVTSLLCPSEEQVVANGEAQRV